MVGPNVGRLVTGLSVGESVGDGDGLGVVGGIVGEATQAWMLSPQGSVPEYPYCMVPEADEVEDTRRVTNSVLTGIESVGPLKSKPL